MAGNSQPLDQQFAIVGPDGRPTLYFTQWAQQRQIDISDGITQDDLVAYLEDQHLSTVQEILDQISTTRGSLLYRGATGWSALIPGTNGFVLKTQGAGADPVWAVAAAGAAWGSITGVLSAQVDLQAALDAKVDDSQISAYGLTLVAAANAAAARTVLGLAAIAASGSGADLNNGTVTLGKIASQAAATILGNNTGGAASPIALTATQAKALLAIAAADVSGLAAIAASGSGADLAATTVTYAKIQNVSATDLILGRSSAGAGVIQEIPCTAAGRALIAGANIAAQRITLDVMSTAQVNAAIASGSAAPLEIAPTKPVAANFTLDNGGAGGTMTNGAFGVSLIRAPAGGNQISVARSNTAPSAVAFTLTARLTPTYAFFQTGYSACIILRNSTNGRLLIFGDYQGGTNILVQGWSSYSAFANNVLGPASAVGARFPWRRVVLSAGTLDFQCSPDGDVWQSIGTTTVATYLTAAGGGTLDQVGFGEFSAGGTLCQSWTVV